MKENLEYEDRIVKDHILLGWIYNSMEAKVTAEVMGYEPKDFREAGFDNSDLLLYMDAIKLDFKSTLNRIKAGVNPDLKFYPASDKDNVFDS